MKYRCIKEFYVPECDDGGFEIPNEYVHIEAGSEWQQDERAHIIDADIHLDRVNGLEWLEISKETLAEAFEIMEG